MNDTIAELLAERKKLDAKIRRAVAKAFPVGSRWEYADTLRRSRKGTVFVLPHKRADGMVWVQWESEFNPDAAGMYYRVTGRQFAADARHLAAISSSASPAS